MNMQSQIQADGVTHCWFLQKNISKLELIYSSLFWIGMNTEAKDKDWCKEKPSTSMIPGQDGDWLIRVNGAGIRVVYQMETYDSILRIAFAHGLEYHRKSRRGKRREIRRSWKNSLK